MIGSGQWARRIRRILLQALGVYPYHRESVAATPTVATCSVCPDKLGIIYCYPSLLTDGSTPGAGTGDLDIQASIFGQYNIVVFGGTIEEPLHGDHIFTTNLISTLQSSYGTKCYGYVAGDVSSRNFPLTASTPPDGTGSITEKVTNWHNMGVDGIFLDTMGSDYGVVRSRLNFCLDLVHSLSMSAFVNAWKVVDVFATQMDNYYIPGGINNVPSSMSANDIYLQESFVIQNMNYQAYATWKAKADLCYTYKNSFGTEIACITTQTVPNSSSFDQVKFDYAWWAALLYGFDHFAWGETYFASGGHLQPMRTRPDVGDIGTYTSAVSVTGSILNRKTTKGTIYLNTGSYSGSFIPD